MTPAAREALLWHALRGVDLDDADREQLVAASHGLTSEWVEVIAGWCELAREAGFVAGVEVGDRRRVEMALGGGL